MPKTKKQETGDIGEKIAGRFLVGKGFEIIGWNYRKPWGEIDIIVRREGKIHFIEVKTVSLVSWTTTQQLGQIDRIIKSGKSFISERLNRPELKYTIHETGDIDDKNTTDGYRPEDTLHPWKLKRLKKAIQSYLSEKRMSEEDDWAFDAVTVRIDTKGKTAIVEYLEDIIL